MIRKEKIKVLLVDDSQVITVALSQIINLQHDMTVIGMAGDPYEAVDIIKKEVPDVLILDVQMPKMDGITFLKKIMNQHPMPVIIFSSVAEHGSENALKALKLGAVSILPKPQLLLNNESFYNKLTSSIRAAFAAKGKINRLAWKSPAKRQFSTPKELPVSTDRVIAIGASTGGTQALNYIFRNIKKDVPGIVVVQHMPGDFTRWFAEGLNRNSHLKVEESSPGKIINRGDVYIANGYYHLLVKQTRGKFVLSHADGIEVNRHKPSVDVLFNSVAQYAANNAIGILLTGMGDDGARGLLNMRNAGAVTIAQDEDSSVVFGMPREAIKLNAAKYVMNLNEIISFINNL